MTSNYLRRSKQNIFSLVSRELIYFSSPLNVNAFPATPRTKLPLHHNLSVPRVEKRRISPFSGEKTALAILWRPEDTATVIQRVEHRTVKDAIMLTKATLRHALRMSGVEWASRKKEKEKLKLFYFKIFVLLPAK